MNPDKNSAAAVNADKNSAAAVNAGLPIVRDEVHWGTVESVKGQLSLPERARASRER